MSNVCDYPQGPIVADHRHGVSLFAHAYVKWRTANANILKEFVDEIDHKRLGIKGFETWIPLSSLSLKRGWISPPPFLSKEE